MSMRSAGAEFCDMYLAEVENPDTPCCVRSLHGKAIRARATCGDGACGIHAVFGMYTGTEYRKEKPRAFLRHLFGPTSADFYTNLADDELFQVLQQTLWQDLIKPCALHAAGVRGVDVVLREEGKMVWKELMYSAQEVAQEWIQASQAERRQHEAFAEKRNAVVFQFSRLCKRSLEYAFVRPLMMHLDKLEEFENIYPQHDENGAPMSKFDLLFTSGDEATRLQKGIVESFGVRNFHILYERINDVVTGMTDELNREAICAFRNAVAAARDSYAEYGSLPSAEFFTRVYPAYLRAMTDDHSQYYLSVDELLAACKCAQTNVAIFKNDVMNDTFKLERFYIHDDDRPVVLASI